MSRLNNRKLKRILKDTCNGIETPNVRDRVKQYPIYSVENNTQTKRFIQHKRMWISSVAICCIAVLSICLGVFLPLQNNSVTDKPVNNSYSYVTIDINPSVTIQLDGDRKVVGLTNNNYDGGVVIEGINVNDLKGKDMSVAVEAVLDNAAICGFIAYDSVLLEKSKNAVKVVAINDDGKEANELMVNIVNDVKNFFSYRNIFALVVGDNATEEQNNEILEKYGVTYGKYAIIKDVFYQTGKASNDKTQTQKDLDNFIKANKNAKVSKLYEEMRSSVTDNSKKIYRCVFDGMVDSVKYIDYISNIVTNNNIDLDTFIDNELQKNNFEELWAAKSKLFYSSIVLRIIDMKDTLFHAIGQVVSETSSEFITFIDWIRSIYSSS